MPVFLLQLFSFLVSTTKSIWTFFAQNVAARELLLCALIVGAFCFGFKQCTKSRQAREALRVSNGQVARLRVDSTEKQTTISQATAIISLNYEQQANALQADSVHAATLPDAVLDRENDSLLAVNTAYLRQRAKRRNQPATQRL